MSALNAVKAYYSYCMFCCRTRLVHRRRPSQETLKMHCERMWKTRRRRHQRLSTCWLRRRTARMCQSWSRVVVFGFHCCDYFVTYVHTLR